MNDQRQQDQDETKASTHTAWEQRRRLVQAIMDSLMSLLDRGAGGDGVSLRDIILATDVSLDTIRARVAHQAFAGGPPEAFWPPMRTVLGQFAPQLGELVCGSLEMDPAYEIFWEPETHALLGDLGVYPSPRAQEQSLASRATRLHVVEQALMQRLQEYTQELVARGGPSLLVGRYLPLYQTAKGLFDGKGPSLLPHGQETSYPLAAVLAAIGYDGAHTLQEDWTAALGMEGPLPISLHATGDGHYTAMLAESVVLEYLIWLSNTPEMMAYVQAIGAAASTAATLGDTVETMDA